MKFLIQQNDFLSKAHEKRNLVDNGFYYFLVFNEKIFEIFAVHGPV